MIWNQNLLEQIINYWNQDLVYQIINAWFEIRNYYIKSMTNDIISQNFM